MKSRGESARMNDVIAYVITGDGEDYNKNVAERAYSPQDVTKADSDLKIGIRCIRSILIYRFQLLLGQTNSTAN